MSAAASLRQVYGPGGCLCGEPPTHYVVTAMGGAIQVECRTMEEATRYFARWAEGSV